VRRALILFLADIAARPISESALRALTVRCHNVMTIGNFATFFSIPVSTNDLKEEA
jgi:hypothetical protein